jgi:hypothetical protein
MYRWQSGPMHGIANPQSRRFKSDPVLQIMESNAAGMVRRPALKTGFPEMGWGSTPLLSAKYSLLAQW